LTLFILHVSRFVLYFVYFVYSTDIPSCNSVWLSYWIKGYLLTYLLTVLLAPRRSILRTSGGDRGQLTQPPTMRWVHRPTSRGEMSGWEPLMNPLSPSHCLTTQPIWRDTKTFSSVCVHKWRVARFLVNRKENNIRQKAPLPRRAQRLRRA